MYNGFEVKVMFEHFSEIDLHIVELPVEVQDGKPVYQGFIQEFPYMQAIANSKRELNKALMEQYYAYVEDQRKLYAQDLEEEPMTSSLLSYEELLKYYDGEQFDGFEWSNETK